MHPKFHSWEFMITQEDQKSFPNDWTMATSTSGWMNSDIFLKYIVEFFYPFLVKTGAIFPVILFVDGHGSHLSARGNWKACKKLKIILFNLYPNATFLIQPADVSVFKSLKV